MAPGRATWSSAFRQAPQPNSPLSVRSEISVEQLTDEFFIARKSPETWRNFWLATDVASILPVRLGAEAATVDECFEAILSYCGMAFTGAFVPVTDIPPTELSVAWRSDVDSELVRDFVQTARIVASLKSVPDAISGAVGGERELSGQSGIKSA